MCPATPTATAVMSWSSLYDSHTKKVISPTKPAIITSHPSAHRFGTRRPVRSLFTQPTKPPQAAMKKTQT